MDFTPQLLLDQLTNIFPEFQSNWDSDDNYFRKPFTLHGVFAQFSHFYKNCVASFKIEQIVALSNFVNNCMESKDENLDNAAATCFVENIAGEDCARHIAPYFRGEALRYFNAWGGVPIEDAALREFLQRRHPQ
jgi:hypothetical protein